MSRYRTHLRTVSISLLFLCAMAATADARRGSSTQARDAVRRIIRNPSRVTARDRNALKPLKPVERAQLLAQEGGYRLEAVSFAKTGGGGRTNWQRLHLPDDANARKVYKAVMGPNQVNYIARTHSRVMWGGKVVDFWNGMRTSDLRHGGGRVKMMPIWLSPDQAKRYQHFIKYLSRNASTDDGWTAVMGGAVGFGRCGAWPLNSLNQRTVGNSCTTPVHRAPVGERKAEYAWMDQLASAVKGNATAKRAVRNKPLYDALTGKSQRQVSSVLSTLRRALPRHSDKIDKLETWVGKYHQLGLKDFHLDWHGRQTLADVLGVKGDHPGPGSTIAKIRGRQPGDVGHAVGLDVKFE